MITATICEQTIFLKANQLKYDKIVPNNSMATV